MRILACLICCGAVAVLGVDGDSGMGKTEKDMVRQLPPPVLKGKMSLEEAIARR